MQALIPILGAAGGTAAAGTGLATAASFLSAGSAIAGGISAYGQAKGEKERAQINAFTGKTRAMQTNVSARAGLNEELATLRATLGANGQRMNVGTTAIFNELRNVRGRERRIEFGNRMSEAADWKMAGKNAQAKGTGDLLGGFIKAGPSLFDIYAMRKRG